MVDRNSAMNVFSSVNNCIQIKIQKMMKKPSFYAFDKNFVKATFSTLELISRDIFSVRENSFFSPHFTDMSVTCMSQDFSKILWVCEINFLNKELFCKLISRNYLSGANKFLIFSQYNVLWMAPFSEVLCQLFQVFTHTQNRVHSS